MADSAPTGVYGTSIEGVTVVRRSVIPDERGAILHMLRRDDPLFTDFGEVYFSLAYPGVVKGWHRHLRMTLNYCVVAGEAKIVLFDDRSGSATRGGLLEVYAGVRHHVLLQIPPGIWNGYKNIGRCNVILANCASLPNDPDEIERLDPMSDRIPYSWGLRHG